jgi:tRNA A37 threonylcarbamoyladenosine biosynthesis protein TsaE
VVVVEWADRVAELMPAGTIHVRIDHVGETARRVTVE